MENKGLTNINDAAYQKLIDNITTLWGEAKSKAIAAVNTELLDANWQTGKYIVEFEQGGKQRAEYGKRLLVNLNVKVVLKIFFNVVVVSNVLILK